jgi:hypothetical protein
MAMQPSLFSINGLSVELGRNARAISKALANTPAEGMVGPKKTPGWKLVTALRALEAHDRRNKGGALAADPAFEARAARAEELADSIEQLMREFTAMPDVLERRRASPATAQAIQEWSRALTDATPVDQRPFSQPFIDQITGAAYSKLLAILEWQVEP